MVAGNSTLYNQLLFLVPLFKWGVLIILFFYAIFALIIVRQVSLMSKTLLTPVSPIVKAVSILHAGFAIGLIVLFYGLLK